MEIHAICRTNIFPISGSFLRILAPFGWMDYCAQSRHFSRAKNMNIGADGGHSPREDSKGNGFFLQNLTGSRYPGSAQIAQVCQRSRLNHHRRKGCNWPRTRPRIPASTSFLENQDVVCTKPKFHRPISSVEQGKFQSTQARSKMSNGAANGTPPLVEIDLR